MVKYTEEVLREAVAASVSIADVLRHLGLPQNGGAHAHIRRRIDALGIDTSHFLRRAWNKGRRSGQRLRPEQILVLRPRDARRAHPEILRRAMQESGIAMQCDDCGVGQSWNGKRLTLHVDHINGEFWDCRPHNLRLLCPNCHSQTPTYAGRNRRVFGTARVQQPYEATETDRPQSEAEILAVIARVDRRELSVTRAAEIIGCHRNHYYRLRKRFEETGSLSPRRGARRWRSALHADAVIAYALAHPDLGPKSIARGLREIPSGGCTVSHGTVSNILREAGLSTIAARRAARGAVDRPQTEALEFRGPAGVA